MIPYAKLIVDKSQIVVPICCFGKLLPVFPYKESALRDPRSDYLVVDFTEFSTKTAAFVLCDAYNDYLTRQFLHQLIEFMRKCSLKAVLWIDRNVNELTHILILISKKCFWRLPQR